MNVKPPKSEEGELAEGEIIEEEQPQLPQIMFGRNMPEEEIPPQIVKVTKKRKLTPTEAMLGIIK